MGAFCVIMTLNMKDGDNCNNPKCQSYGKSLGTVFQVNDQQTQCRVCDKLWNEPKIVERVTERLLGIDYRIIRME